MLVFITNIWTWYFLNGLYAADNTMFLTRFFCWKSAVVSYLPSAFATIHQSLHHIHNCLLDGSPWEHQPTVHWWACALSGSLASLPNKYHHLSRRWADLIWLICEASNEVTGQALQAKDESLTIQSEATPGRQGIEDTRHNDSAKQG